MTSKYINALLVERLGYERRGLTDRVAMVDAQLRELGYDHEYLTESETETAAIEPAAEQASIKRGKKKKI